MGEQEDLIDNDEMNKEAMHLDDTFLISIEQRHVQDVATDKTKETGNNKDQENTPESSV